MRGTRLLSVLALTWVSACTHKTIDLQNLDCDNGTCVDGFICNPLNDKCGAQVEMGCGVAGRTCPSDITTGDPCPGPNAFLPCTDNGPLDCSEGCRVCQADGSWGGCEGCILGDVVSCASCNDDCTAQVGGAVPICNMGTCDYNSCTAGFVDADGDRTNGCECIQQNNGIEIACNGIDEDCDGSDLQATGTASDCAMCGDDCTTGMNVTAAICDTGQSPNVCAITGCLIGFADIDGLASNGCEAMCTQTNGGVETCDGVDNDCDGAIDDMSGAQVAMDCNARVMNAQVSTWACNVGQCTVTMCNPNFHDINMLGGDGCEYACTPAGAETCDGTSTDEDCNNIVDDVADIDTDCAGQFTMATDVTGWACGATGVCEVASCTPGQVDINMLPVDGCEAMCTQTNGGNETCDSMDNDCNGTPDDVPQMVLNTECAMANMGAAEVTQWACSSGSCVVGMCTTDYYDEDTMAFNGCEYNCTPMNPGAETCDGEDNDCDGETDDADTDLDQAVEVAADCGPAAGQFPMALNVRAWNCSGGCTIAQCRTDFYDITGGETDGCEYPCAPMNPGAETCDGEDNDCDGDTDALDTELDMQAEVDADCLANTCSMNCGTVASWACSGAVCVPSCNMNQYDDNTDPRDGCEYFCNPTSPGAETCDGEDNDCNGDTDAMDPALNVAVDCGTNYCSMNCGNVSAWSCSGGMCSVSMCSMGFADFDMMANSGCECTINPEVCDNADNDCDGLVDTADPDFDQPSEINPDCASSCSSNCMEVNDYDCVGGVCTIFDCDAGFGNPDGLIGTGCECTQTMPATEVCDGVDNDCDGDIDTADADLDMQSEWNTDCGNQHCTGCSVTTWGCNTGACEITMCTAPDIDENTTLGDGCECTPVAETCDNMDEDCDSVADNGLAGTCACAPSGCTPQQGTEVCGDGCDNDCNGMVDDGCCTETFTLDVTSDFVCSGDSGGSGLQRSGNANIIVMELVGSSNCGNSLNSLTIDLHAASNTADADVLANSAAIWADTSAPFGAANVGDALIASGVSLSGGQLVFNSIAAHTVPAAGTLEFYVTVSAGASASYFAGQVTSTADYTLTTSGTKALGSTPLIEGTHSLQPTVGGRLCTGTGSTPTDLGPGSQEPANGRTIVGPNSSGYEGTCGSGGACGTPCDTSGTCTSQNEGAGAHNCGVGWTCDTLQTTGFGDCSLESFALVMRTYDREDRSRFVHIDSGVPLGLPMCSGLTMRLYASRSETNGGNCDDELLSDHDYIAMYYYNTATAPEPCSLTLQDTDSTNCASGGPCAGPDTPECGGGGSPDSEYMDTDLTAFYGSATAGASTSTLLLRYIPEDGGGSDTCDDLGVNNGPSAINTVDEIYFFIEP